MPKQTQALPKSNAPIDEKAVQILLANLEKQTKRADEAERQLIEARNQTKEVQAARDEWKNLYLEETKATNLLRTSLAESRNESANLRIANAAFANQRELDKNFISDQAAEIKNLRRSRWKYAAGGFVAGFAAGVPTGGLIAVKFNF